MKIVTNKFLKRITLHPKHELYDNSFESPELSDVDKKMEDNSLKNFSEIVTQKKKIKIQKLYKERSSNEEKEIVLRLASIIYYASQKEERILNDELKKCQVLLNTDACKRNIVLYNELLVEIEKLESALDTDTVKLICTNLNDVYKNVYKDWGPTKRYVRVSEIMHIFRTPNMPYFYTERKAEEYAKANKTSGRGARKFIYDMMREYIIE